MKTPGQRDGGGILAEVVAYAGLVTGSITKEQIAELKTCNGFENIQDLCEGVCWWGLDPTGRAAPPPPTQ